MDISFGEHCSTHSVLLLRGYPSPCLACQLVICYCLKVISTCHNHHHHRPPSNSDPCITEDLANRRILQEIGVFSILSMWGDQREKKLGLLGKTANSSSRAGKVQSEPWTRKQGTDQRLNGVMFKRRKNQPTKDPTGQIWDTFSIKKCPLIYNGKESMSS